MMLGVGGKTIQLDDEGYLVEPGDWDEHLIAADARFLIKYIAEGLGYRGNARGRLFRLFPYGYVKQACKIAGMKRPRAWSTG